MPRGLWTTEEDEALAAAVEKHGLKFGQCAASLQQKGYTRSLIQCRERWQRCPRNPALDKFHVKLTADDEARLVEAIEGGRYVSRAAAIRGTFPGHSVKRLSRRYVFLKQKQAVAEQLRGGGAAQPMQNPPPAPSINGVSRGNGRPSESATPPLPSRRRSPRLAAGSSKTMASTAHTPGVSPTSRQRPPALARLASPAPAPASCAGPHAAPPILTQERFDQMLQHATLCVDVVRSLTDRVTLDTRVDANQAVARFLSVGTATAEAAPRTPLPLEMLQAQAELALGILRARTPQVFVGTQAAANACVARFLLAPPALGAAFAAACAQMHCATCTLQTTSTHVTAETRAAANVCMARFARLYV